MESKAPNWYPDPSGDYTYRYWNGEKWTEHVSTDGKSHTDAGWPRQVSASSAGAPGGLAGPTFVDPDDATRWKMVHSVRAALDTMMDKYQECFEKAEHVEKAYAMANTEYVNGIRQHELSRKSFHEHGVSSEKELLGLLAELRAATSSAESQWKDLMFLLPGSDNDVIKLSNWCMANGVPTDVFSSIVGNAMFVHTDFGLTRQSFWTENERVIAVLNQSNQ